MRLAVRLAVRIARLLAVAACLALAAMPALAEEAGEEKPPPLEIARITVEPEDPGPDTLCKLRVTLKNRGSEAASRFVFEVRVGGKALPVYRDQMVLLPVAAGETAEIPLHNFWSSETSRPYPKDGKLAVEVTLLEATWVKIEDKDGVEERAPLGAVEGLPVTHRVILGKRSAAE